MYVYIYTYYIHGYNNTLLLTKCDEPQILSAMQRQVPRSCQAGTRQSLMGKIGGNPKMDAL